jgi:L-amino acid N-acyltransferase YncA
MTFKIEELTSDILDAHLDDFIETLNNLVPTEALTLQKAQEVLQKVNAQDTHIYVAMHDDGHLVGSISLMIEQKFIR